MKDLERGIETALLRGDRVYIVIESDFFKATLSGPELKLGFIRMTDDEVISEVKRRMNEEV